MEKLIKEFSGFSGSRIFLMQNDNGHFVRKIGNIERNVERITALSNTINMPKLYHVDKNYVDMEYLSGLDMKTYLLHKDIDPLIDFLIDTLKKLSYNAEYKSYKQVFENKLSNIDFTLFPFGKVQLIKSLSECYPESKYHGDFTLDNVIYCEQKKQFYMIDPLTTEYDSFIFDLAKLTQDLRCGWFVRNSNVNLTSKLQAIYDAVTSEFEYPFNDSLTIAMLLRVYPYCKTDFDKQFIINNVRNLWTS